jgi:hypothetical protein
MHTHSTAKRFERTDVFQRKVGPPPTSTLPSIERSAPRNYIQSNAMAAITQTPPRAADEMRFVSRPGYGEVPKYLGTVKQEIMAEKRYIEDVLSQQQQQYDGMHQTRLLKEDERLRLLEQLKNKWESVNVLYQTMTHLVKLDTIGKVRRKEDCESQLATLEKNIEKMSKPYVFVEA